MENADIKESQKPGRSPLNEVLCDKANELISAIRSINHDSSNEIKIGWDTEPCYWQRKEWVDWILELADEVEKEIKSHNAKLRRRSTAQNDEPAASGRVE